MAGKAKQTPGITRRHLASCPAKADPSARCRGKCPWIAWVYDARAGRKIRTKWPTYEAALSWRSDALSKLRRGELRASPSITLREAADKLVAGMRSGAIRKRSGEPYRRRFVDDVEDGFKVVVRELGEGKRLGHITVEDCEWLVKELLGRGLSGSRVRNLTMGLRILFRVHRRSIPVNPMAGIPIPTAGKRDRALAPEEIDRYLAALSDDSEARLYYALAEHGLRAGEILGLDVEDVKIGPDVLDGAAGAITVRRALSTKRRELDETKTPASRRTVPVFDGSALIRALSEHLAKTGRSEGLLFGRDGVAPPDYRAIMRRAERRFKKARLDTTVTAHVFRHSAGSIWLRAGVAPTTAAAWLGDSIETFLRVYAHVIKGLSMASEIERVHAFRSSAKVKA